MSKKNTKEQNDFLRNSLIKRGALGLSNGSSDLKRIRKELVQETAGTGIYIPTNLYNLSKSAARNTPEQYRLLYDKFCAFGEGLVGEGSVITKHKALLKRLYEDEELIAQEVDIPGDWRLLERRMRNWGGFFKAQDEDAKKRKVAEEEAAAKRKAAQIECSICGEKADGVDNECHDEHVTCEECSKECHICSESFCSDCLGNCRECYEMYCDSCGDGEGLCTRCAKEYKKLRKEAYRERQDNDGNQYNYEDNY